ncbi:MAG: SDR family NAD(P)-dependent oxidoreductase [Rickettsiella sp.]|nr:SDR family NAD(P)-dependent oxidoreductase [Rickettsiella sp.]
MVKLRVKDKVALITGAAAGIGKATAELLAQEGADVILSDIRDQLGGEVAKTIGDKAVYWHLDVRKEEEWQKIIQSIEQKYSRLDILINNAGITGINYTSEVQDPEHTSLESWHHIYMPLT